MFPLNAEGFETFPLFLLLVFAISRNLRNFSFVLFPHTVVVFRRKPFPLFSLFSFPQRRLLLLLSHAPVFLFSLTTKVQNDSDFNFLKPCAKCVSNHQKTKLAFWLQKRFPFTHEALLVKQTQKLSTFFGFILRDQCKCVPTFLILTTQSAFQILLSWKTVTEKCCVFK